MSGTISLGEASMSNNLFSSLCAAGISSGISSATFPLQQCSIQFLETHYVAYFINQTFCHRTFREEKTCGALFRFFDHLAIVKALKERSLLL